MIEMRFPDGSIVKGKDATDVLIQIAKVQYEHTSIEGMKYVLAARAHGWNNSFVNPTLDDDAFVRALGETGMVFVTDGTATWDVT